METNNRQKSTSAKRILLGTFAAIAAAAALAAVTGYLLVSELLPQQAAVYAVPVIAMAAVFLGIIAAGRKSHMIVCAVAVTVIFFAICLLIKLLWIPGPMENTWTNIAGCIVGAALGVFCTGGKKKRPQAYRRKGK